MKRHFWRNIYRYGNLYDPRLGAASVIVLVVVGQMPGASAFRPFGRLGVLEYPATLVRPVGPATRADTLRIST
jgi:uncharacterized membrane protein YdcZ (DUF606 family)